MKQLEIEFVITNHTGDFESIEELREKYETHVGVPSRVSPDERAVIKHALLHPKEVELRRLQVIDNEDDLRELVAPYRR